MIEISYDRLILLLTIMGIGLLAVTWGLQTASDIFRRRRRKKTHIACRLCGYHFLNPDKQKLIACPHCGGLNERSGKKRH